ncbi:DNA-processing protein DprA [Okeania sp.]|uniref:DNA-processing protein DprA n=1 Tax=Okeania sp. TaxID=3100323 RepID=UPI002B4B23A4|nr:DNA-processing protein DprA [Okeania sp.]MEB3339959.1 DNA-processing protein DprA [Okeania sp.]
MSNHVLSPDAQAIMLLCASFGENRNIYPEPLTLSEYNRLAKILIENQLGPGDLLTTKGLNILLEIEGKQFNDERLVALLERGGILAITLEKWVNQGLWIITRSDRNYPRKLKRNLQYLAPAIIYGVGNIELLEKGGLAIVGSRDISEEEREYTNTIGKLCASQGINVISGGAKGTDIEAMLSSLEVGGTAVGVLADSLNKASVSIKYREGIRDGQLALISTYDPNSRFTVGNAMGRNKYIYGLSDYALVVSSGFDRGGTWAGATEVLQKYQKISVFVKVEGTVKKGNLALLDRGAIPFPIEPWNDDLKELLLGSKTESLSELESSVNLSKETSELKSEIQSDFSEKNLSSELETPINLSKETSELESEPQLDLSELETPINLCKETSELELEPQSDLSENDSLSELKTPVNISDKKTELIFAQKPNLSTSEITNQSIYKKVLPIILEKLTQPYKEKDLVKRLEVRTGQLRNWLKIATEERKIIKNKNTKEYEIVAKTQKNQTSTQQLSIYQAVLPIILDNLEKPQKDKNLATKLNVNISQLQDWLKIATEEKKVISEKSNIYVISPKKDIEKLPVFDAVEDDEEEGLDW